MDKNLASRVCRFTESERGRADGVDARAATLWIIAGICVIPAVGSVDRARVRVVTRRGAEQTGGKKVGRESGIDQLPAVR